MQQERTQNVWVSKNTQIFKWNARGVSFGLMTVWIRFFLPLTTKLVLQNHRNSIILPYSSSSKSYLNYFRLYPSKHDTSSSGSGCVLWKGKGHSGVKNWSPGTLRVTFWRILTKGSHSPTPSSQTESLVHFSFFSSPSSS